MPKINCSVCGRETYLCPWEGTKCYTCKTKERLEKLAADLQSGEETETSCEDCVVCPYCGCAIEPDFEADYYCQEGDYTGECPACGRKFNIETHVDISDISYDTTRRED